MHSVRISDQLYTFGASTTVGYQSQYVWRVLTSAVCLLFRNKCFKKHAFVNCDFSGSRWFMAGFSNADCSGSSFSGINAVFFGLTNVDCTGCNFSQAQLEFGISIENAKFCGADFSGATLKLSKISIPAKIPPHFTGAVMTGCKFINESQHVRYRCTGHETIVVAKRHYDVSQCSIPEQGVRTALCSVVWRAFQFGR